jgi:hypothetical protein
VSSSNAVNMPPGLSPLMPLGEPTRAGRIWIGAIVLVILILGSTAVAYSIWDSHQVRSVAGSPMIIDSIDPQRQAEFDRAYDEAFRDCPAGTYNRNQPGLRP